MTGSVEPAPGVGVRHRTGPPLPVSVVVPSYNEARTIGALLDDLRHQTRPPAQVICADASVDDTRSVIERHAGDLPLVVVAGSRSTAGSARNRGALAATEATLVFLDADCRVGPSFLEDAYRELVASGAHVATCLGDPLDPKLRYRVPCWVASAMIRLAARGAHPAVLGACVLVTREWHGRVEGFDERITLGEDVDYGERIVRAGGRYALLRGARFAASTRRAEQEGVVSILWRYLRLDLHRRRHGYRITRNVSDYRFGHYDDR